MIHCFIMSSAPYASRIHSYYTLEIREGIKYRKCNAPACSAIYKCTGGNGTLVEHLKRKHSVCYQEYRDALNLNKEKGINFSTSTIDLTAIQSSPTATSERSTTSSSSNSLGSCVRNKKRKGSKIDDYYQPKSSNDTLYTTLAKLFAMHSLPQTLIESPVFHQAIDALRTSNIPLPSIRELVTTQDHLYKQMKLSIIDELSASKVAPCYIAFDGWTDVNGDKITNIVIGKEAKAFY
jgi:hypothetical protein